jgi:hypothetical protein
MVMISRDDAACAPPSGLTSKLSGRTLQPCIPLIAPADTVRFKVDRGYKFPGARRIVLSHQ